MKKVLMSVIMLFAFVFQASADFSGGISTGSDEDKFRPSMGRTVLGTVTSIDEKKGDINVMDEAKHYEITVHLKAEDRSKVKFGDRVKILTQPNTNVARTILPQKPLDQ
ncbi:MAG TPA: hypothetical protein PLA83_14920 [Deltaproteobacteria bacterium]|nr:hypothetical protein [Deltaproteobacteria bacterium]